MTHGSRRTPPTAPPSRNDGEHPHRSCNPGVSPWLPPIHPRQHTPSPARTSPCIERGLEDRSRRPPPLTFSPDRFTERTTSFEVGAHGSGLLARELMR